MCTRDFFTQVGCSISPDWFYKMVFTFNKTYLCVNMYFFNDPKAHFYWFIIIQMNPLKEDAHTIAHFWYSAMLNWTLIHVLTQNFLHTYAYKSLGQTVLSGTTKMIWTFFIVLMNHPPEIKVILYSYRHWGWLTW